MSNIEKGRIENFIKAYEEIKAQSFIIESINKDFFFEFADCLTARIKELEEEKKTMCEEYCPKTERIQELEEENKEIKNTKMNGYLHENIWLAKYLSELYLPKQKAKEKIEENNIIMINMQNRHPDIYVLLDEWRNAKAQNKVLEELLEDK